jgi:hypothetical protein
MERKLLIISRHYGIPTTNYWYIRREGDWFQLSPHMTVTTTRFGDVATIVVRGRGVGLEIALMNSTYRIAGPVVCVVGAGFGEWRSVRYKALVLVLSLRGYSRMVRLARDAITNVVSITSSSEAEL